MVFVFETTFFGWRIFSIPISHELIKYAIRKNWKSTVKRDEIPHLSSLQVIAFLGVDEVFCQGCIAKCLSFGLDHRFRRELKDW